jgi:membrane protein DedA with SNARE-associated domain
VDELLQQVLANAQGLGAYALVFAILVLCGLGVPLPEDISLILGGFLAYRGAVNFPTMASVGFVGILVGDSLIYLAGRRLGAGALHGPLAAVVTPEKRQRVEQLFRRHGEKIVMAARFFPGVRAVTYFTAGSARMRYWRFIAFDGLAALVSAPAFVYLGFRLGGRLEWLIERLRNYQLAVWFTAGAVLIAVLVLRRRRRMAAVPEPARAALDAVVQPATATMRVEPPFGASNMRSE